MVDPGTKDERTHRKWEVALAEELHCKVGVYVRRWRLETPWFSIRLHHWLHSDDNRAHHDHPWDFVTFVIKGTYIDEGWDPETQLPIRQRVKGKHFYYRSAKHAHWVHLDRGPAWTVIFTGPKVRRWGFWDNGRWVKSFRYFYRRGDHTCD